MNAAAARRLEQEDLRRATVKRRVREAQERAQTRAAMERMQQHGARRPWPLEPNR